MDTYDTIANLCIELGSYAAKAQADIEISIKDDGSILTEVDTYINDKMTTLIRKLFPMANIVAEESKDPWDSHAPLTFVLDPIDGTDMYSQGAPSWCIALGILDKDLQPVGGMVCAPRWGLSHNKMLFLRKDPHKPLLLQNTIHTSRLKERTLQQIALSSNVQQYVPMHNFTGKMRCFGSNILHMISPLISHSIQGSLSTPCYVWDFCAAHALLLSQQYIVRYANGDPLIYTEELLQKRKPFEGLLLAGTPESVSSLTDVIDKSPTVPLFS